MQPFDIFRAGRHTASGGQTLDFSEEVLRAAVAAYDPALHEAPIVVGHPRDNEPAYGWVSRLEMDGTTMRAVPAQVEPQFADLVAAGRFKKRSASFYTPDAPNNPKPGTYYLRHVGFLGAQPPAVKGLREVKFSADAEAGVIEFADYSVSLMAQMARRMREFFISKFSLEDADSVLPDYLVGGLEAEANRPAPAAELTPVPSFSETNAMSAEHQSQLDALKATAAQLEADLAKEREARARAEADFAEKAAALKARERAADLATVTAAVDALVTQGRVLPPQRAGVIAFAAALDATEASVEFDEAGATKKVSPREWFMAFVQAAPASVQYGELAPARTPGSAGSDNVDIANRAAAYRAKAASEGRHISFTEAVTAIHAGKA